MRIEHDIKPVTYMKTRAAELLRAVDETPPSRRHHPER